MAKEEGETCSARWRARAIDKSLSRSARNYSARLAGATVSLYRPSYTCGRIIARVCLTRLINARPRKIEGTWRSPGSGLLRHRLCERSVLDLG